MCHAPRLATKADLRPCEEASLSVKLNTSRARMPCGPRRRAAMEGLVAARGLDPEMYCYMRDVLPCASCDTVSNMGWGNFLTVAPGISRSTAINA